MTKSKEELDLLKTEVETVNQKLEQLSEDELKYVSGGIVLRKDKAPACGNAPASGNNINDTGAWGETVIADD